jgi:hypothetical protein
MGREGCMIHLWGQDNKVNLIELGIFNMVPTRGPIAYQHWHNAH